MRKSKKFFYDKSLLLYFALHPIEDSQQTILSYKFIRAHAYKTILCYILSTEDDFSRRVLTKGERGLSTECYDEKIKENYSCFEKLAL